MTLKDRNILLGYYKGLKTFIDTEHYFVENSEFKKQSGAKDIKRLTSELHYINAMIETK